ncbi:MAG: 4Fe-4S binding protein [Synergistaceae bacterium]|nr:4Fe-4S binding protein [Synergistaceae bacterium]
MLFGGLAGALFADTVPFLDESRCLNRRNRFEPCSLCESVCDFHAVTITAGPLPAPVINEKKCTGCGLCARVCPSEALKLRDYKIFRDLTGNNILRCRKSGGTYCLKSLSPALLASAIFVNHDISLVMPCENCGLNQKISCNNLDTALKFLDALKIQHNLKIIRDENFESELSRRDLIALIFAKSRNKGSSILEDIIWHDKNNVFISRKFLEDNLDKINAEIEAGLFYDFSVSENCNACGVCEAVCPSGAWKIAKSDSKAELRFYISDCTGCMLCVKKCPEGAVNLREKIFWPVKSRVKKNFEMTRCRHCGKWFIVIEPEQELCDSCSRQKY